MRGLKQLFWVDLKLYFREPVAAFFTLAFPALMVVLFGAIYGNKPDPLFEGRGAMDISMPAYTALVLALVGLLSVPIATAAYRERGVLRRFRATPLKPTTYIVADILANLLMTALGMMALVAFGWALYRVRLEGRPLDVALALILSALAMFAVGYLIAGLAPGARSAQIVGMAILYPMIFLSGATVPLEVMPRSVERISNFLPLTYAVRLLRGMWFGEPWGDHLLDVGVLAGVLIVCGSLASRFFRWGET
jgi:ABC-2 type transport system permease protein